MTMMSEQITTKTDNNTEQSPSGFQLSQPSLAQINNHRFQIGDLCKIVEKYLSAEEISEIFSAYLLGAEAHQTQTRRSGEAYIFHPLAVAGILAELGMDKPSLVAALLHDVLEDTPLSKDELAKQFGEQVAELVDGLSKLRSRHFPNKTRARAASFYKLIHATIRDVRVIIIKLADRLHNIRTIQYMKPDSRRRIARETIDFYAPIALSLGMGRIAWELESLAFKALYPWRSQIIQHYFFQHNETQQAFHLQIEAKIQYQLEQLDIKAHIQPAAPRCYPIYQQAHHQHGQLAMRRQQLILEIVVSSVDECYRVLGVIHNLYKHRPGSFKDYIAVPRRNHYQSLHSKVIVSKKKHPQVLLEVRIRSQKMQHFADYGITSQDLYKLSSEELNKKTSTKNYPGQWFNDIKLLKTNVVDDMDFMEMFKIQLSPDEVYVFTPKGKTIELPRGATLVDFAYAIHSDIGNHLIAAKIDGINTPSLHTILRNGQTVEIVIAKWSIPKPEWLNSAITARARSQIRRYLHRIDQKQAKHLGKRLLNKELKRYDTTIKTLTETQRLHLLQSTSVDSFNQLLVDIGLGKRLAYAVAHYLHEEEFAQENEPNLIPTDTKADTPLLIKGSEGMVVGLGLCCHPIPGDPVKGLITPGQGITVHRENCPQLAQQMQNSCPDLSWAEDIEGKFPVTIYLEMLNTPGGLAQSTLRLAQLGINIESIESNRQNHNITQVILKILVTDRQHLAQILRRLKKLKHIHKLCRKT